MRKVLYQDWIPIKYEEVDGIRRPIENSGKYTDFNNEGIFHCWGYESIELSEGCLINSVALIETPCGSVKRIEPERIKFIDGSNSIS